MRSSTAEAPTGRAERGRTETADSRKERLTVPLRKWEYAAVEPDRSGIWSKGAEGGP